MNLSTSIIIFTLVVMLGCQVGAQIYDTNGDFVQTFAGSGFSGHVDGQGTQTMFNNPTQIVADSSGNLFVLDSGNFCIRKITTNGTVSTFVGGGSSLPGYGTNVSLSQFGTLKAMAIDHSNVLWIAAGIGASILRVGTDGYTTSQTNGPWECDYGAICVDSSNNIYFSDSESNRIFRFQTNGTLEVFAGSGNLGSQDGNGIFTSFNSPGALASDAADNIYVFDFGNHLIRRINQNADVVTIAGNGTSGADVDGQGLSAAFIKINSMCSDNAGKIPAPSFLGSLVVKKQLSAPPCSVPSVRSC